MNLKVGTKACDRVFQKMALIKLMEKPRYLGGYCLVTVPMNWIGRLYKNRRIILVCHMWQEISQIWLFKSHFYFRQSVDSA